MSIRSVAVCYALTLSCRYCQNSLRKGTHQTEAYYGGRKTRFHYMCSRVWVCILFSVGRLNLQRIRYDSTLYTIVYGWRIDPRIRLCSYENCIMFFYIFLCWISSKKHSPPPPPFFLAFTHIFRADDALGCLAVCSRVRPSRIYAPRVPRQCVWAFNFISAKWSDLSTKVNRIYANECNTVSTQRILKILKTLLCVMSAWCLLLRFVKLSEIWSKRMNAEKKTISWFH